MDSKQIYQLARDAHLEKDRQKAEALYKQVISECPDSDEAKASYGHLYYIQREAKQSSDAASAPINVVITDIQIPFWSMVLFMVNWAIASIPAFIILLVAFSLGAFIGIIS